MRVRCGALAKERCNNDKCRVVLKNVDGRGIMDLTRVVVCMEKGGAVSRQQVAFLKECRKIKGCGSLRKDFYTKYKPEN